MAFSRAEEDAYSARIITANYKINEKNSYLGVIPGSDPRHTLMYTTLQFLMAQEKYLISKLLTCILPVPPRRVGLD